MRAATLPLIVAALALVFRHASAARVRYRLLLLALCTLPVIQAAYTVAGALPVEVALLALFVTSVRLSDAPMSPSPAAPALAILLLTLAVSEFTFQYVGYSVHRVGFVPASLIVLALRMLAAAVVLSAALAAAAAAMALGARNGAYVATVAALAAIPCLQVAYFYIDWYSAPLPRFAHATTVAAAAVGAAAALSRTDRGFSIAFADITAAGLVGLLFLQFASAYRLLP